MIRHSISVCFFLILGLGCWARGCVNVDTITDRVHISPNEWIVCSVEQTFI